MFYILVILKGDVQVDERLMVGDVQINSGRRTGCLWKTHSLIMRDVSVYFQLTHSTILPLYTSRGLGKSVSVHTDR